MEWVVIAVLAIATVVLLLKLRSAKAALGELSRLNEHLRTEVEDLQREISELSRFKPITDIEAHCKALQEKAAKLLQDATQVARSRVEQAVQQLEAAKTEAARTIATASNQAEAIMSLARSDASKIRRDASDAAATRTADADTRLKEAGEEAARIIAAAKQRAEDIAGDAYTAMQRAKEFSDTAQAMQNIVKGYGDTYIVPTFSILDELADEFGYTEAGEALKHARSTTRALISAGRAATCDYVEPNRRETAIRFVIDAFNGKVDSILARGKSDNHGKLEQEIRDAFALVNHNGRAFRDARITDEYLGARLAELKWGATVRALKEQEREEQRQLREQIREEEEARREYERAIKEAAKEGEMLRKAMEKVQKLATDANEVQRAEYEAKLAELQDKLQQAEDRSQLALSMAQQTRAGHVYVISNIGSFGEEVFKIGMTRRLEPKDRIRELGDASVPFEFDIHAMLYSEDAPALEKELHRRFLRMQMNKVNPRKEFFRVSLADIRHEIDARGIDAHWTMTAEARDYRETLRIEQELREDPHAANEWTRHQLEYEPESSEAEAVEAI